MLNIITGEGYKKEGEFFINKKTGLKFPDLSEEMETEELLLDTNSFAKYIDILTQRSTYIGMKDMSLDMIEQNICFMSSFFSTDYFIKIDLTTYTTHIPVLLSNAIRMCKESNNAKRFYIIPIALEFPNVVEAEDENNPEMKSAHANIVIVDTWSKKVEYFEPHGKAFIGHVINFNIEEIIINIIALLIDNVKYTFKNVQMLCPMGIQAIQNIAQPESGYCLAWALLFIHLRVINSSIIEFKEIDSDDITAFLLNLSPSELNTYIKKYINYIKRNTQYMTPKLFSSHSVFPIKIEDKLKPVIKERIKYLLRLYYNYKIKDPRVFSELISYRSLPYFQDEFIKFFNKSV